MKTTTENPSNIPDTIRVFESTAAILMGIGKFVLVDMLDMKFYFILGAFLFWMGYIVYRVSSSRLVLKTWGFRWDNFQAVLVLLLPFGILSVCAFVAMGLYRDTMILNWHLLAVLMLYPIWGTIQQFLVVGLIAGNLEDMKSFRTPKAVIIVFTSMVFSLVHYPSYMLMAGTFLLALLYSYVYLRDRNLYVLGLFHGWLGGLFYFLVLGRDAWVEVFSSM